MSKKSQLVLIMAICLIGCAACAPTQTPAPTATMTEAPPTATPSIQPPTPTPIPSPTVTQQPPITTDGYAFLLQTDFSAYQIIDISQRMSMPFDPPGESRQYNLAANLSPSQSLLAFPQRDNEIAILNLDEGQVTTINPTAGLEPIFSIEAAQEAAQQALSEIDFLGEITTTAIQDAYDQSTSIFRWYQNDTTWLIAGAVNKDRTNLHTYDLETGELTQLETAPGLVQSVSPGPSGEEILLKKSFLFNASTWEDDRYYLLNVDKGQEQPLPLPEKCDLPQVFWFDAENIGIIHQAKLVGGIDFSLFNIEIGVVTQVFSGEFTELSSFDNKLLILSPASSDNTTRIELRTLEGDITNSETINSLCTISHVFENQVILNCEMESLILEQNLQGATFDDPVFILSQAPAGDPILSVVRTGEIKLLDSNLMLEKSITLEAPPLEIRWMPDSSGFLYRGRGKIYWYELSTESSDLLIESDLFNDYTNINGVWIGGN